MKCTLSQEVTALYPQKKEKSRSKLNLKNDNNNNKKNRKEIPQISKKILEDDHIAILENNQSRREQEYGRF